MRSSRSFGGVLAAGILSLCIPSSIAVAAPTAAPAPQAIPRSMESSVPVAGDFMMGPTSVQLTLAPGEEGTATIEVTNREGKPATYSITTEDFSAGTSDIDPTRLYGEFNGPYPARSWLHVPAKTFTLQHGERAFIPVKVQVTTDAEPGDHYAALLVQHDLGNTTNKGLNIVSRVGALFLITVKGPVIQKGSITGIQSQSSVFFSNPAKLRLTAKNDGTVHMIPSGTVQIRNIFGFIVDEIPVENWIVLRQSSKVRDLDWSPRFALGRYTATANLKAFGGQLESVSVGFWMIPLVPVLGAIAAIFIVSFLVQYFFSSFEIRRKKP